jgi:hypothetical protein
VPLSTEQFTIACVRTVRNNLFHGGKFPMPVGPVDDVAHNTELVSSSLRVLRACLRFDSDVRASFEAAV